MKGMVLTGPGGPERLHWREDLPEPLPGPGEVRVRVAASSVNNTDINYRLGWYGSDAAWSGDAFGFPRIQGIDAAGRIEAAGPGVDPARIGERVLVEPCLRAGDGGRPRFLGTDCDGAFADCVVVPARHAHRVESPLPDTELAVFPCAAGTALNLLTRAGARAGETVFVTGASGGVGSMAVQIARALGLRVLACCAAEKAGFVRDLGAEATIARGGDPVAAFGAEGADLAVDLEGGPGFARLAALLRPGGRIAVAGAVAGTEVTLDLRPFYLRDLALLGCTTLAPGVFAHLVRLIEAGALRSTLAQVFPLRDLAAAQAAFLARATPGKIGIAVAG